MAIDLNNVHPIMMDIPEGDPKTGETVAINDKGWIIQSMDKDSDTVVREFDGNAGGFLQWLVDTGYTKDDVNNVIKGDGLPTAGIPFV